MDRNDFWNEFLSCLASVATGFVIGRGVAYIMATFIVNNPGSV